MTRHFGGAFVAASLLVLIVAAPAFGHAELEESDPAEGETIQTPYTVTATFSTNLDPDPDRSFIVVLDFSNAEVARGGVTPDDPTVMTVDLPALPPGDYRARWQAYDPSDDHIERRTINFTVSAAAPSPTITPGPTPTAGPTTAGPTATPQPTPSPPAITPSPTASPTVGGGQPTGGGSDALLAIVLAALVIGAVAVFLFTRSRR